MSVMLDLFEQVEVEADHTQRSTKAAGASDQLVKGDVSAASVHKPGKGVEDSAKTVTSIVAPATTTRGTRVRDDSCSCTELRLGQFVWEDVRFVEPGLFGACWLRSNGGRTLTLKDRCTGLVSQTHRDRFRVASG